MFVGEPGDVAIVIGNILRQKVVALRDAMGRIERGHAVVLQVEHAGNMSYVAFER